MIQKTIDGYETTVHPSMEQAAMDQGIRPAGYDAPIEEMVTIGKYSQNQPIVTNQQMLSKVTPEEAFECMRWLFFDYAKEWSDSKVAIIEWLKAEKDVKRW